MKIALVILAVIVIVIGFMAYRFISQFRAMHQSMGGTIVECNTTYGEDRLAVLGASETFWTAMEAADEAGMRSVCDSGCTFVHIGITCKLDQEIGFYTGGIFQPTELVIHDQSVDIYGGTAVVITDCDYALLLGGMETSHHFAVTEVFARQADGWKLVQFSFTALSA